MVQNLRFIGVREFSHVAVIYLFIYFSPALEWQCFGFEAHRFLWIADKTLRWNSTGFIAGFTKSSHTECGALILVMGNLGEAQVNWLLFESHTSVLLLDFLFIGGSPFTVAPCRYRSCLLATSEMQDLLPSCTRHLESVLNLRLPCGLNAKALV